MYLSISEDFSVRLTFDYPYSFRQNVPTKIDISGKRN